MILAEGSSEIGEECKPRASGDDPKPTDLELLNSVVNPARAGMIPAVPGVQVA